MATIIQFFFKIHPVHFRRLSGCLILTLLLSNGAQSIASASGSHNDLQIVVSLRPLHSLVASISTGISEPVLLLNNSQSPHHTSLRPSDYKKLADADIVFWAGKTLEPYLSSTARKFSENSPFIALAEAKGIRTLPLREKHAHHHNGKNIDPHVWLATDNAAAMLKAIARELITLDPKHKEHYEKNLEAAVEKLSRLRQTLHSLLKETTAPFITYHDAYQYFEAEFGLRRLASVTLNEESAPGIRHVRYLKQKIKEQAVHCLFYDAPLKPRLITTLQNGSSLQAVELDALGLRLQPGKTLWFDIMLNTGKAFASCLKH